MLLLDTHVVIWLALEPDRISRRAVDALLEARRSEGGLAISTTTLWEIALLHKKGRIRLDVALEEFLARVEAVYRTVALTRQVALRGVQFGSEYPRDPADRQIGGTALVHGLQLVTADTYIRSSGEVPCIW